MKPELSLVFDCIASEPSFEEAMSILTLAQAHMFMAPPTDLEGVYRLRSLVSILDAIASRSEGRLQKVAA